jgi:hypothetical protein
MATLKQLRDQIIIDTDIVGSAEFPSTRLNRIINLAQRYVQAELNGLGMKKWESSQAITAGLVAGAFNSGTDNVKKCVISATYFTNMLESPKSIKFIEVNDGSNYGVAREIDVNSFQEQLSNTYLAPVISSPVFMRLANYIWLAPSSITSATAYYYKAITDLSADADTTEIPIEFEEFIIKKAGLEINTILGKLQDKQNAVQQLERDLSSVYDRFIGKVKSEDFIKQENKAKLQ